MPTDNPAPSRPMYDPGDVLIAKVADGSFQVSRVSANGHSLYVMGSQSTEPAALRMAERATSGSQRVFIRGEGGTGEYKLVA